VADGVVQVQRSSIEKARKAAGGGEVWLLLRTNSGSLEEFAAAADEANTLALAEGGGWGAPSAEAPTSSPGGFALVLTHAADKTLTGDWNR
jgi:hypothetical protein